MSSSRQFYLNAIKKTGLIQQGFGQLAHQFAAGSVPTHTEAGILELPVITSFQQRLRNSDGSRNYPADYAPADAVPAY